MNILKVEHIHKIFGGKVIFDDISCASIREKNRHHRRKRNR